MIEVRIHGRGAQGAVTAAQLLAIAAFYDNKESQAFPFFGPERCGAPVESYVRIDDKPINIRSQIYNPDIIILLDPSLLETVDITKGIKKDGICIINTNKKIKGIKCKKIYTVDASSVAQKVLKNDFVNTIMLGAFAAATNLVSLKSLNKAIDERFKPSLAELNKKAIKEAYDNLK